VFAFTLVTLLAVVSLPSDGLAQPAASMPTANVRSVLKNYTGTVVQVDTVNRLVWTRGADGQTSTFEVPPSMPPAQLAGFRAGDLVTVTFYDGVGVRRKPAGEPAIDSGADPASGLRTATATITALDPAAGTVTFVGPRGRYTRSAADPADLYVFQGIAMGERADVTYYEYVSSLSLASAGAVSAIATPPPAPMPLPAAPPIEPESLRHRLTLSLLVGLDNQFSGKMITPGSGVYNGLPISFDETTYDEVYGRMGLLKAGIGYRTSPRAEVTVNFVWSDSSSQLAQVGTVGANNVPLTASFDDYTYWGVEAGQRFYFTRVRFTPFVGYYAGINRFTHIDADFYATGNNVVLDVQDAQFYDSSWAFSFGPTGGLLIGLGPLELMGQVELRYMGGLSDVDPLSVADLKDINAESSRWSVPFLGGIRIRF
jgi:hypothetical protein